MLQTRHRSHLPVRRLSRRRLLGAGAVAAGGAITAGCSTKVASNPTPAAGGGGAQGAPKTGGTFNGFLPLNAPLDPQKVSAQPQRVVAGVYNRLFRFKSAFDSKIINNHDLENEAAVSAETPDAITWTVKLRPDVRFSNIQPVNGHAFEAEDVKATFSRILDPAISSPNRAQLGMIDATQIQTPDRTTVVFKLKFPYAPFNKTLASPAYALILPREALAGSFDPSKVAIGSGPFTLESVQPDIGYTYKKNPDYFEKGLPYVDAIHLAVMPDAAQQLAQFAGGNIDENRELAIANLDTAKQRNPKATVIVGANGTPNPMFWQLGDPTSVFQDVRVRRAFSLAVDRDTLTKVVYQGQATAAIFLPAYMGKWAIEVKDLPSGTQQWYKYDPAQARQLLAAAGASNLQLRVAQVIGGPGSLAPTPIATTHLTTLNNMFNAVGIKTNIVQIDYNKDYVDAGKGSSQGYYDKDMLVFGGFSPYTEADEYLFSYFDSNSLNSHTRVKDPQLDAMIDKERVTIDQEARLKAVQDIQKYVADKMYQLSTVGQYTYYQIQPRVQSYAYSDSIGMMTETYMKLWLNA